MDQSQTADWYTGDPTQTTEGYYGYPYAPSSSTTIGLQIPFETRDQSWSYNQIQEQHGFFNGLTHGLTHPPDAQSYERPIHHGGLPSPADPNPVAYSKQGFPVAISSQWVPTSPLTPPGGEAFAGGYFGGLGGNEQASPPVMVASGPILTSPTAMTSPIMGNHNLDSWAYNPAEMAVTQPHTTEKRSPSMSSYMGVLVPPDYAEATSSSYVSAESHVAAKPELEIHMEMPDLAETVELTVLPPKPKKEVKKEVKKRKPRHPKSKEPINAPPSLRTATRRKKNNGASLKAGESEEHLRQRENHNAIEKEYRDRLHKGFEELLETLSALPQEDLKLSPGPDGEIDPDDQREEQEILALIAGTAKNSSHRQKRMSKAEVLQGTCRIIKFLGSGNKKLQREVMDLRGDVKASTGSGSPGPEHAEDEATT
ncbi:hypothetical protein QBC35DRAFT_483612 [Podospora australis]|uniref:BHLH domain-containing protein n=1 Tax=Podospora australis TaxID=1536484 RepID=A0AAN7AN59_9PEZI|nr:hypothetical protein QBC35DRAFT_483612 [Podospora australis]